MPISIDQVMKAAKTIDGRKVRAQNVTYLDRQFTPSLPNLHLSVESGSRILLNGSKASTTVVLAL